jgi:hypothetical protein
MYADTSGRDLLREFWPSNGELDMLIQHGVRLLQGSSYEDFLVYRAKDEDGNDTRCP